VTISAIQLRLDNWGRWGRGERFFSAQTSPLYQLYRENNPDILTDAPQRPRMTDPADAFKVDQAIAQSCLLYQKDMLRLKWVKRLPFRHICSRLRIPRRDYERLINKAEKQVEDYLQSHEGFRS